MLDPYSQNAQSGYPNSSVVFTLLQLQSEGYTNFQVSRGEAHWCLIAVTCKQICLHYSRILVNRALFFVSYSFTMLQTNKHERRISSLLYELVRNIARKRINVMIIDAIKIGSFSSSFLSLIFRFLFFDLFFRYHRKRQDI